MNKSKTRLKIIGMHCVSCSLNIDGELEDTDGILRSSTSYAKQVSEVEFDPEKITPKKMIEIIQQVGYDAQVTK